MGESRYDEAQSLLLAGYEGLVAHKFEIPRFFARHRLAEAQQRLVDLYEAWGRPEVAAEWRAPRTTTSPDSRDLHRAEVVH